MSSARPTSSPLLAVASQATDVWKTPGSEFGSTHLKPTDDSGMSGHPCVEDAVLNLRVEDKECYGFLPDRETLVCHVEARSQMQLRNWTEFRRIASIQDILSVQEMHDTDLFLETEKSKK